MKQILLRAVIAIITFAVGVASNAVWNWTTSTTDKEFELSGNCRPQFDLSIISNSLREDDDPQFFKAFQAVPVYALPDCVDEAYSLTWIPAFHGPVFVQVWRSNGDAFMVAKTLDRKGWFTDGNVNATNARPLTNFEWHELTETLNRASFWELASNIHELEPQDGAVWIIDGVRTKQYHWTRRRVPNEQYAEVCKHLIRLSGLETAHALYLPRGWNIE